MRGLLRIVMASVLLIGAVPKAGTGSITSIHPPHGPGGTGTALIDPQTSSAADISLNFTAVAPISITLEVDGAGGYLMHTNTASGGILNNTGVPWTSLLFEVAGPAGTMANTIGLLNPLYLPDHTFLGNEILLFGGTVPVGAQFNIDLGFATTQAGQVTVTYIPNFVVPEPCSIALLGIAVVGAAPICVIHRRHRRSRADDL